MVSPTSLCFTPSSSVTTITQASSYTSMLTGSSTDTDDSIPTSALTDQQGNSVPSFSSTSTGVSDMKPVSRLTGNIRSAPSMPMVS